MNAKPPDLGDLSPTTAAVLARIARILAEGYTGEIKLRCNAGSVCAVGLDDMAASDFVRDRIVELRRDA